MENFLNASNYKKLCDYYIDHNEGDFFGEEIIKNNSTIFCKTDYINELFDNLKVSKYKHNIITHHSDITIDEGMFNSKPECVNKWFAINSNFKHEKLIPIPIGIRSHEGIYHDINNSTIDDIDSLRRNIKLNNIYCNWRNTCDGRNNILEKINGVNIVSDPILPYKDYLINMSKCKYVLSPPGKGLDNHRTWEALYLGCIPIVIKHDIYDNWPDLPILQIEKYEDITMDLLDTFSYEKPTTQILNIKYWEELIKNYD